MKELLVGILFLGLSGVSGADELAKTYRKTCGFCHESGVAGAPRAGDKVAWAARLQKGDSQLLESVVKGLGAMPPGGLCSKCQVDDFRALIKYMAAQ